MSWFFTLFTNRFLLSILPLCFIFKICICHKSRADTMLMWFVTTGNHLWKIHFCSSFIVQQVFINLLLNDFFGGEKLNFYTINSCKMSLYAALQGRFLYNVLKLVYSHFNSIEMIIYLLKNVNSINSKDVFECSFGRET